MNKYIKEVIESYFDDNMDLFEMANLSTRETKLPVVVWISIKPDENHKIPRIKFVNEKTTKTIKNNLVPLSITDDPYILSKNTTLNIPDSDFELIRQWVIKNKEGLLKVWNDEITPTEFVVKYLLTK